jgi:class 3 adenylate cyclase
MMAPLACVRCGAELRSNAVSATPAEYKQVTVLFADVVRSMDIPATMGAERLRETMTELVTHAAAVVQRYGGAVDKFTGDDIMAVFGAPVALEDHALRACLAALGIQEDVTRPATGVQRRDGIDLRLRVGLNSGQVIAGEIGSAALGYTTGRDGTADGVGGTAGGGDAQRLHRATGRGRGRARGAATGAYRRR